MLQKIARFQSVENTQLRPVPPSRSGRHQGWKARKRRTLTASAGDTASTPSFSRNWIQPETPCQTGPPRSPQQRHPRSSRPQPHLAGARRDGYECPAFADRSVGARTIKSLSRSLRNRANVFSREAVGVGKGSSSLVRAMSSPETRRSFSPATNSVLNISDRAVDSHVSSGRPDRLRKPRTAMERRAAEMNPAERWPDSQSVDLMKIASMP